MKDLEFIGYKYYQPKLDLHVIIPRSVMHNLVNQAFPNDGCENGGFIVGHYESSNCALIEDVIVPPRISRTFNSFTRYTDGMEPFWNDLLNNYNQIYLGEWHSHPNDTPSYSIIDKKTMIHISESPGINISFPIFLIVGYNKQKWELQIYTVKNKKVYTYGRI